MQRHEALRDLSRDHRDVLHQALLLRRAVEEDDVRNGVREALRYWSNDGKLHLAEELEVLVPRIPDVPGDRGRDAVRSRLDRLQGVMHELSLAQNLGRIPTDLALEAAEALRDHARWQEDILFEGLQDALGPEDLDKLGKASRAWREENRPWAIGPGRGR